MLPTSYLTAWSSGALYAELYIGMCRALAAPWLSPWMRDSRPGARSSPPAQPRTAIKASAAVPTAEPTAMSPTLPGASIIPFDRARARRAARS